MDKPFLPPARWNEEFEGLLNPDMDESTSEGRFSNLKKIKKKSSQLKNRFSNYRKKSKIQSRIRKMNNDIKYWTKVKEQECSNGQSVATDDGNFDCEGGSASRTLSGWINNELTAKEKNEIYAKHGRPKDDLEELENRMEEEELENRMGMHGGKNTRKKSRKSRRKKSKKNTRKRSRKSSKKSIKRKSRSRRKNL
jgi:hypothetical protein